MLIIGNGESRKGINLNNIKEIKIGCNAIFRDFEVNHLVCVDKRMLKEVFEISFEDRPKIWSRKEHYDLYNLEHKLRILPDIPYPGMDRWDLPAHWGAGPYAVLLGAKYSKEKKVKLIGFDLYSKNKLINNIYKGTKNYAEAEKPAVDPRYWIYQISKIFECFADVEFTVYAEENWELPKSWKKFNVSLDKISNIV